MNNDVDHCKHSSSVERSIQQRAPAKLCGVVQGMELRNFRVPPILGRATITLGIGPHSSLFSFRNSSPNHLQNPSDCFVYQSLHFQSISQQFIAMFLSNSCGDWRTQRRYQCTQWQSTQDECITAFSSKVNKTKQHFIFTSTFSGGEFNDRTLNSTQNRSFQRRRSVHSHSVGLVLNRPTDMQQWSQEHRNRKYT